MVVSSADERAGELRRLKDERTVNPLHPVSTAKMDDLPDLLELDLFLVVRYPPVGNESSSRMTSARKSRKKGVDVSFVSRVLTTKREGTEGISARECFPLRALGNHSRSP